jgi:GT2 family glycosyltransferase
MKFSIIIPNYNGEAFIKDTVESLINGFKDVRIVVVDDASTDKSIDIINSIKNNRVRLICKSVNGGFASAVNKGIRYCKENDVEFAIVANSDIDVTQKNCSDIVKSFCEFDKENVGVLGFLEFGDKGCRENENISGFLFALRLSVVDKVGYLDEIFYMYGEEQDFFRRVISYGYQIKQTGILIKHNSEMSGCNNNNSWLSIRNSIYLEVKRKNWILIIRKIVVLFLLINRIYRVKNREDNSLIRITRPGIVKGNIYLFKAIIWNFNKIKGNNDQPKY